MPGDRTRRARSIWRGKVALYVQAAVQFCGAPRPPTHYPQSPPAPQAAQMVKVRLKMVQVQLKIVKMRLKMVKVRLKIVENGENAVENGESAVENG